MSDYIDRQALLDDLDTLWDMGTVDGIASSTVLKQVKTDIKNVPSADVQPVRHGKWERKMDGVYCSECYLGWNFITGVPRDVESGYSYCPNCGARMDGAT